MERRQREGARFRARFGARLTTEELPSSGVVVRIAKSGSVNGGAIREGRGAVALNEERQHEEGLCGGEEWLRGGAPAWRSGCGEERSREENLRCCAVAVRGWCGAPARRSGCVEERSREENLRCYAVVVRCWCGVVWCGVMVGNEERRECKENEESTKTKRRNEGENPTEKNKAYYIG